MATCGGVWRRVCLGCHAHLVLVVVIVHDDTDKQGDDPHWFVRLMVQGMSAVDGRQRISHSSL